MQVFYNRMRETDLIWLIIGFFGILLIIVAIYAANWLYQHPINLQISLNINIHIKLTKTSDAPARVRIGGINVPERKKEHLDFLKMLWNGEDRG